MKYIDLKTGITEGMKWMVCKTLCLFLLFSFASCQDTIDEPKEDNPYPDTKDPSSDSFYFNFSISVPGAGSSTRSTTTNGGTSSDNTLAPSANESKIENAVLYFCTKNADNNYVLQFAVTPSATNSIIENPSSTDKSYTHNIEVEVAVSDIKKLLGNEVYVFFVGNQDMVPGYIITSAAGPEDAVFSSTATDGWPVYKVYGTVNTGEIMPLVNAEEFKISGFKDISVSSNATNAEVYEKIKTLFTDTPRTGYGKLYPAPGVLPLERAMARVDFKTEPQTGITQDYTYKIEKTEIYIQLAKLQMLNLNSKAYLFRHGIKGTTQSAFGVPGETSQLFLKEKGDEEGKYNWIYGADWTANSKPNSFLNNTLTKTDGKFTISGTDAEIEMTTLATYPTYDDDKYHPWCYIYENTIPTVQMMTEDELYRYATGLAFKFKVLGKPDSNGNRSPLTKDTEVDDYPPGITKCTDPGVTDTDKIITITNPDGYWMNVEPDSKGYYWLTYYGFIAHNNAADQTIDGTKLPAPMKYGIVRNNVYQLSINKIKDIPNPEEPRSVFLEIQCNVKVWNVRWDDNIKLY